MDDLEAIRLIREGGRSREQGIAALFKSYAKPFRRFFLRHGVAPADADDLVQETFVSIVRYCGSFRNDCEIRIWLWKIARNSMLALIRKGTVYHDDIDDLAETIADERAAECPGFSLEDCVKGAFARFEKDHAERAETLLLATVEGWSTNEVSSFLGRSLGATREYISQCRKFFKPYLEPCRDYL